MTEKPNGGPAFPHLNPNFDGNWDQHPERAGMSLRDYFAAQYALAILGNPKICAGRPGQGRECQHAAEIAQYAYLYADAMLQERAKP